MQKRRPPSVEDDQLAASGFFRRFHAITVGAHYSLEQNFEEIGYVGNGPWEAFLPPAEEESTHINKAAGKSAYNSEDIPMEITRRQTLAALSALVAAASLPCASLGARTKKEKKVRALGIQLFMLRHLLDKDFEGTLRQVADIGYREVEINGFYGRTGAELRGVLDQFGLSAPSAHIPLDPRFPGTPGLSDPATIESLLQVGVKQAVVPIFPLDKVDFAAVGGNEEKLGAAIWKAGGDMTADDWKSFAHRLNETGLQIAKSGLTIGYHNHNLEFAKLSEGSTPLDILIRETDPTVVKFELDLGWAIAAGVDVFAFLTKHADRINQLHIKDTAHVSGTGFNFAPARFGAGIVDWNAVLGVVEQYNIEHLYIEQEEPFKATAIEEARIAFDFMSNRPELANR